MDSLQRKRKLFEYLVYLLEEWRKEKYPNYKEKFTKLKLQKILFLVSSYKATTNYHPLLNVFDNFYACTYGPVEMDIHESMCDSNFEFIIFENHECVIKSNIEDIKKDADDELIELMKCLENTINEIKESEVDYITVGGFDLVDIVQKWTCWIVSKRVAEILNNQIEQITTKEICESRNKPWK